MKLHLSGKISQPRCDAIGDHEPVQTNAEWTRNTFRDRQQAYIQKLKAQAMKGNDNVCRHDQDLTPPLAPKQLSNLP